ncbi:hypothetical protein QBC99_005889 [Beijerinckia sp. GAS462]|nr:hypothetical protein [Beijerinckia sp. GAS462]SED37114.1 hypothetical protein SAMN05443249_5197 [Beijerinckia sp. 28-YEA-48]
MQSFSLTEPATIFWRDNLEEMKIRPESRYFPQVQDAIIWAFETLSTDQRWSAKLRLEKDQRELPLTETEEIYKSFKSN